MKNMSLFHVKGTNKGERGPSVFAYLLHINPNYICIVKVTAEEQCRNVDV